VLYYLNSQALLTKVITNVFGVKEFLARIVAQYLNGRKGAINANTYTETKNQKGLLTLASRI